MSCRKENDGATIWMRRYSFTYLFQSLGAPGNRSHHWVPTTATTIATATATSGNRRWLLRDGFLELLAGLGV